MESRTTSKFQATIPKKVREKLKIKAGDKVVWRIVREFVVVEPVRRVEKPVQFLTSQIHLDLDAVALIRSVREEFG
jgi:AbrB family looped-hinge helix DNA binding protein